VYAGNNDCRVKYDDLYTGVMDALKPGGTFVLREAVVSRKEHLCCKWLE
jgi:hypothetical protein